MNRRLLSIAALAALLAVGCSGDSPPDASAVDSGGESQDAAPDAEDSGWLDDPDSAGDAFPDSPEIDAAEDIDDSDSDVMTPSDSGADGADADVADGDTADAADAAEAGDAPDADVPDAADALDGDGARDGEAVDAVDAEDADDASDAGDADAGDASTTPECVAPRGVAGTVAAPTFVDVTDDLDLDVAQWTRVDDWEDVECAVVELMTGGASAVDFDDDGDIDLHVLRQNRPDALYRNDGGTFTDVAGTLGLDDRGFSSASTWVDIEGDGDLDVFVTFVKNRTVRLYVQGEDGTFTEESVARGLFQELDIGQPCTGFYGVAATDLGADDDLDVVVLQWRARYLSGQSLVYENDGTGHFSVMNEVDAFTLRQVPAFTGIFSDISGDGTRDFLLAADFEGSALWRGTPAGPFEYATLTSGVGTDENGMGAFVEDIDGDGDFDWFISAIYEPGDCDWTWGCSGNRMYVNRGDGTFDDCTDAYGVREGGWGWGSAAFDVDNDTDLDVGMTNGLIVDWVHPSLTSHLPHLAPFVDDPIRLWMNDGELPLREASAELGLVDARSGKSFLPFDYDDDGDLDIFVTNNAATPTLFRNDSDPDAGWMRVDVRREDSNRFGIGAIVSLRITDESEPMIREIRAGDTYGGTRPLEAHFGLGPDVATVREVRVTWPDLGETWVVEDVPANRRLRLTESDAAP